MCVCPRPNEDKLHKFQYNRIGEMLSFHMVKEESFYHDYKQVMLDLFFPFSAILKNNLRRKWH